VHPGSFLGQNGRGIFNTPPTSMMKIMSEAIPLLFLPGVNSGKFHFLYKIGFENLIDLHSNNEVEAFIPN
jgi:hypothetical protein